MAGELNGKRIAFLVAQEGVEEVELTKPWAAVKQAGARPELVAPAEGEVQAFNHLDKASTFPVDKKLDQARPTEYDGVVLPGGVANPDELRTEPAAVEFLREAFSEGKPVGVICHGPWTLVEADVVRGRRITSWPSLKTNLRNAGANWVDQEVVVDGNLISSRKPDDIPAFNREMTQLFARASTGAPLKTQPHHLET